MFIPILDFTIILLIPAIILSIYAQFKIKSTFNRYFKVSSNTELNGAQVAERLLAGNGVNDVGVEMVQDKLADHYDPRSKKIRLSPDVYKSNSLASLGVAAHETGHAIQHNRGYFPLEVRAAMVPATNIGSSLSFPLIIIGIFAGSPAFLQIGILAFTLVVLFHLVTLPVEFNASSRAVAALETQGLVMQHEVDGIKKVLNAAALTYVAAAIVAAVNLIRLLIISFLLNQE